MRTRSSLLAGGLVLLLAQSAAAQQLRAEETEDPWLETSEVSQPADDVPSEPKKQPGTFFIAEANLGATSSGRGGPVLGGLLGVGGKLSGFPPRFYLFGEVSHTSVSSSVSTSFGRTRQFRDVTDLGVGLRVYVPVWGPVRLYGDALLGQSRIAFRLDDTEVGPYEQTGWANLVALGVGPQVRVMHHLSVGARARWITTTDLSGDPVGSRSGGTRTAFTANVTAHF